MTLPAYWGNQSEWNRETKRQFDLLERNVASLGTVVGAVGDGVADDTAALQAALNTGGLTILPNGAKYLITSGLNHVTGAGFVCFNGTATIIAKTGVGGFNITSVAAPRDGLDRNMLRCNGTDNITLVNVKFTTDNINPVVIHGVRITGGMATEGYFLHGLSFSRFFVGSMVALGSAGSGRVRHIHIASATDCGTSAGLATFAGGAQTTVVEIDNDLVASTPSANGNVRIDLLRDNLYSGQALIDFGQQTDGVNIVCQGANSTSGWDIDIGTAERVGELVDIQGFKNNIRIGTAKAISNAAVKLTHGAQYNNIWVGTIDQSGIAAVRIDGSTSVTADRDIKGNVVHVGTITNMGSYGLGLAGPVSDVAAILFSGSTATWKPVKNVVTVDNIIGDGVHAGYLVRDGSGSAPTNDNLVVIGKGSGWVTGSTSVPDGNARVRYLGICAAELTMSATQSIASATATKLAFDTATLDTEGVAVTASNKFTVLWPGIYAVTAQVRMDSWAVGANDQYSLELRQNTTTLRFARGKINFSGKDETALITKHVRIKESDLGTAAADISAWLSQDTGASKTVSNAATMTSFTLSRVA